MMQVKSFSHSLVDFLKVFGHEVLVSPLNHALPSASMALGFFPPGTNIPELKSTYVISSLATAK